MNNSYCSRPLSRASQNSCFNGLFVSLLTLIQRPSAQRTIVFNVDLQVGLPFREQVYFLLSREVMGGNEPLKKVVLFRLKTSRAELPRDRFPEAFVVSDNEEIEVRWTDKASVCSPWVCPWRGHQQILDHLLLWGPHTQPGGADLHFPRHASGSKQRYQEGPACPDEWPGGLPGPPLQFYRRAVPCSPGGSGRMPPV